jgi:hypothetical protein
MATKTKKTPAIAVAYVGVKAIDAAMVALFASGQSFQKEAQSVALSVLQHVATHGDVRVASKLVNGMINAMPELSRINALRAWFEAFGPIAFDEAGVAMYVKGKAADVSKAAATPFWKFKPEEPYQAMDVLKSVEQYIKRLQKDQKETKRNHSTVIAALESVKAGMEAPKAN